MFFYLAVVFCLFSCWHSQTFLAMMLDLHTLIFVSWLRLQNRIAYYCIQKRKETKRYFISDSPHHLVLGYDCFLRHRHTDKEICLPKYSLLWFSIYKANAQTKLNFRLFPFCFLKTHSQKRKPRYCVFSLFAATLSVILHNFTELSSPIYQSYRIFQKMSYLCPCELHIVITVTVGAR